MQNMWKKWDGMHSDPEQQKRIISAKKAENTPVSIDKNAGAATFSGSHGLYKTTLAACTCMDFSRRKQPCKHIYRLAIECGLMSAGAVSSDSKAIKTPAPTSSERKQALARAVELLETYTDEAQSKIREMLYLNNTGKSCPCENTEIMQKAIADGLVETYQNDEQALREHTQKMTLEKLEALGFSFPADLKSTKKARFEWCLAHASEVVPLVYPRFAFIRPAGLLEVAKKKVYTYLLRKYTDDNVMNEDGQFIAVPHGAEFLTVVSPAGVSELRIQFPDDEVTDLLNKHGSNRCTNWKS